MIIKINDLRKYADGIAEDDVFLIQFFNDILKQRRDKLECGIKLNIDLNKYLQKIKDIDCKNLQYISFVIDPKDVSIDNDFKSFLLSDISAEEKDIEYVLSWNYNMSPDEIRFEIFTTPLFSDRPDIWIYIKSKEVIEF